MPNTSNIRSPVTLIAPGRSGTSLVSNIFERHPEFSFAGETANLIFDVWHSIEFADPDIFPLFKDARWVSCSDRAGMTVRNVFLSNLPDEKKHWFQKPIGIPKSMLSHPVYGTNWEEAAEKYWHVMRHCFPEARYLTILRHPCDVILSAKSFWGYDEMTLWMSLGFLSRILLDPSSPVDYALSYDELVKSPRKAVTGLFSHLNIPFEKDVLQAFDVIHARDTNKAAGKGKSFSHKDRWKDLDPAYATPDFTFPIASLYRKFGVELDWPAHFTPPPARKPRKPRTNTPAPETTQQEPGKSGASQGKINELCAQIEKLHSDYTARMREQERVLLNKRRDLMAEHEKSAGWLKEQWKNWQCIAENRLWELEDLRGWISNIDEEKQRLFDQIGSLQFTIGERDAALAEIRNWNAELEKARIWAQKQADASRSELEKVQGWNEKLKESVQWLEQQAASFKKASEDRDVTIAELRNWNTDLEKGRTWFQEQLASLEQAARDRDATIAELRDWNADLEKGRTWFQEQLASARAEAEKLSASLEESTRWLEQQTAGFEQAARDRDATIAELRDWNAELEKGKAWAGEQLANARAEAGRLSASFEESTRDRDATIAELRNWCAELEKGKAWTEEQLAHARAEAEKLSSSLEESTRWLEQQTASFEQTIHDRDATIADLHNWNAGLEKARAWAGEQIASARSETERLTAWNAKLQETIQWLEQQAASFERIAGERDATIVELRGWNAELEKGKAWAEEQLANARAEAGKLSAKLEESTRWLEQQTASFEKATRDRDTVIVDLRGWCAELEKGKVWAQEQLTATRTELEQTRECNETLQKTIRGLDSNLGEWKQAALHREQSLAALQGWMRTYDRASTLNVMGRGTLQWYWHGTNPSLPSRLEPIRKSLEQMPPLPAEGPQPAAMGGTPETPPASTLPARAGTDAAPAGNPTEPQSSPPGNAMPREPENRPLQKKTKGTKVGKQKAGKSGN